MSFESGINNRGPESKKRKIVIADIDIEQQVRDIAEEKLLDNKKDLKGIRGFFKKIWKHNLAHEYYRQKEIAKAKREIKDTGNLYAGENGEKADHEKAMQAITERFQMEYEADGALRKGEEKKTLKDDNPGEKALKDNIQDLIKKYATGAITEAQFILEKNKLFKKEIPGVKGKKGKSIIGKGEMYADNLLEIAKQVEQDIAHNKGLENLDLDFDIIVGRARAGVNTEAQYSAVDKMVEKIQKNKIGKFANEATLASAVAIAHTIIVKLTVGAAQRTAKLAGPLGLGLSAGVGGAVAGIRENKRVKEERAQHAREMAKGGKKIEFDSKRREQMEKFRYETKSANEMAENLKKSLEELEKNPSSEQLEELLKNITEIDSRISFSDNNQADLISFSDSKKVEQERNSLYVSTAEAKIFLKENVGKDWASLYKDENGLKDYLFRAKEEKIQNEFVKEKTIKDEAFQKMKKKKVAWAVTKGLGIGFGAGMIIQEIGAATGGSSNEGILNSGGIREGGVRHFTFLENFRRHISGEMPRLDSSHLQGIALSQNSEIKIPEGFNFTENPDGTFNLIKNSNHEILSEGLKFNSDGSLARESQQVLEQKGILASQFSNHIEGTKQTVEAGASDYIKEHENIFSKIKRGDWADNDTLKPDKNELGLHWGGMKGTGIDRNGNFTFNVKHMVSEGSFHIGKQWNPQELIKEDKLKLLISLSKDTQNQIIEIPIDADGNAIIDPNSEIGKIAFENMNGQAKFIGQFAEVAAIGENKSGEEVVNVLATHSGEGIKNIESIIETPGKDVQTVVFDIPADYDVDAPYVIPVFPRKPLEKLEKLDRKQPEKKKTEKIITGLSVKERERIREKIRESREDLDELAGGTATVGPSSIAEREAMRDKIRSEREEAEERRTLAEENLAKKEAEEESKKLEEKQRLGKMKPLTEEKEHPVRAASWHTIRNIENSPGFTFADINAPTEEEGDRKFLDLTRKLWTELTVHGFAETNPKTGEARIKRESDLDGRGFLKLLELAGIKVEQDKINFVNKGETADSGIIGDTSDINGVVAQEQGKRLVIDHHSDDSDRNSSTTKYTYEMLVKMGLLKKEKYLDNFVEFVTKCDNENFTEKEDEEIYRNYTRNLYGLRDKLKTEEVVELFKKGIDPKLNLSPDFLKEHKYMKGKDEKTLLDFSGELKSNKDRAEKIIGRLEREGFVLDTGDSRFGKILIDTQIKRPDGRWFAKIPQIAHLGRLAVRVKGFGGYIIWSEINKSFVLYTKRPMNETSIPGGFSDQENLKNVRGYMLVKKANSTKPLEMTLEDILGKLSGKADFKIEGRLKEALGKEAKDQAEAEAKAQQAAAAQTPPPQPAGAPPTQPTAPEPTPEPETAPKTPEELHLEASMIKLNDMFSNYELLPKTIEEEAAKNQMEPSKLAIQFIQKNSELNSKYKARLGSIDSKNDEEIKKLAFLIILEDEREKVKEEVDKKNKELENITDNQQILKINSEKEQLEDKRTKIGVDYIHIVRGVPRAIA